MSSATAPPVQVLECAGRHQVLVFVHSRKETAKTARYIKETALAQDVVTRFMQQDSASREILQTEVGGRGGAAGCGCAADAGAGAGQDACGQRGRAGRFCRRR